MLIGPNLNRLDDLMFGKLLDNIFYILATKNEHQVLVDLLASSKWTVLSDNCQDLCDFRLKVSNSGNYNM